MVCVPWGLGFRMAATPISAKMPCQPAGLLTPPACLAEARGAGPWDTPIDKEQGGLQRSLGLSPGLAQRRCDRLMGQARPGLLSAGSGWCLPLPGGSSKPPARSFLLAPHCPCPASHLSSTHVPVGPGCVWLDVSQALGSCRP